MVRLGTLFWIGLALAVSVAILLGCEGDTGTAGVEGPAGEAGASEGTVTGTVTIEGTAGVPIEGIAVKTDPLIDGVAITTNTAGNYAQKLPIGVYTLTFNDLDDSGTQNAHFKSVTIEVSVVAGQTVAEDAALETAVAITEGGLIPDPIEAIYTSDDGSPSDVPVPGGTVRFTAPDTVLDGSTVTGYAWTQTASVNATISGADTATPTVTLGDAAAYKSELMDHLVSHVGTDGNGTPVLQNLDRFMIQPVNPHSLAEAGLVTFQVTVTTDNGGSHTKSFEVHTKLPFATWSTGANTVPLGLPVLLNGKDQPAYEWTVATPSGSLAELDDATVRNPSFIPDAKGPYTVGETNSGVSFEIYGGEWVGMISGQDDDGRPIPDATCTACHRDGGFASSSEFSSWPETGHAITFAKNLNTSAYYSASCFPCHTVGYSTDSENSGFDNRSDYETFLNAGLLGNPGDNWTAVLADYPDSAKLANVQCESCHGPQDSDGGHANGASVSRISVDSGVCAYCHGEPPRHGRFQQWQSSGHGNFALAIAEGPAYGGACAGCHSAQGFVEWSKAATPFDRDYAVVNVPTGDDVQPQTCSACHDPHGLGKTVVRVMSETPELRGGFIAIGVGRGALCMVCHNNNRGPHSTSLYGENYYMGKLEMADQVPHAGPQADVLMGENGFFVTPGARGSHSLITDTCTNCHMEQTLPPADLSYYQSGTNHTFKASTDICVNCHQTSVLKSLQKTVETQLANLGATIAGALKSDIENIAADPSVSAVLLAYDSNSGAYGGMVDDSGDPGKTIASIAPQHSYPYGYDIALMDGTVVGSTHSDMVVWQDAAEDGGNGDRAVDTAEIERGDISTEGIASAQIAGIATNGLNILKAKWNHDLVAFDGSGGVHNPNFVRDILNGALSSLGQSQ